MIWKDVKGYEGLYKVNQHGDVMSNARRGNRYGTHIMKPQDDGHGYRQLCLSKNGKQKSVRIHRLVAEAFVPNPNGYTEVNHIDEDRWNCDASNLEWCSRKYNVFLLRDTGTRKDTLPCDSVNMSAIIRLSLYLSVLSTIPVNFSVISRVNG